MHLILVAKFPCSWMPVFSEQRIKPQHLTQVQFSCLSNIKNVFSLLYCFKTHPTWPPYGFQDSGLISSNTRHHVWIQLLSIPSASIQLNLSQRTFFALLWKFVLTSYISITSVTVQIYKNLWKYIIFFLKMLLERNLFFCWFLALRHTLMTGCE